MKRALLAVGLLTAIAAHADATYDFTAYVAGMDAGGPNDGSFDYQAGGIITYAAILVRPLNGQTDITASVFETSPAFNGGFEDYCGGGGFCNEPLHPTAQRAGRASELDWATGIASLALLAGGVLVLKSRWS